MLRAGVVEVGWVVKWCWRCWPHSWSRLKSPMNHRSEERMARKWAILLNTAHQWSRQYRSIARQSVFAELSSLVRFNEFDPLNRGAGLTWNENGCYTDTKNFKDFSDIKQYLKSKASPKSKREIQGSSQRVTKNLVDRVIALLPFLGKKTWWFSFSL